VGQLIDFEKEGEPKKNSNQHRSSINHYRMRQEAERIGDKTDETVMTFGKIVSIETESYTHKLILKVEHRENRGDTVCTTINP